MTTTGTELSASQAATLTAPVCTAAEVSASERGGRAEDVARAENGPQTRSAGLPAVSVASSEVLGSDGGWRVTSKAIDQASSGLRVSAGKASAGGAVLGSKPDAVRASEEAETLGKPAEARETGSAIWPGDAVAGVNEQAGNRHSAKKEGGALALSRQSGALAEVVPLSLSAVTFVTPHLLTWAYLSCRRKFIFCRKQCWAQYR